MAELVLTGFWACLALLAACVAALAAIHAGRR